MTSADSDKKFKKAEHSRERAAVKIALAQGQEIPHRRHFGDCCQSDKDGKQYSPDLPNLMRK